MLSIVCYLLFVVWCLMCIDCDYLLFVVRWVLFVAVLFVVCCVWFVGR